LLPEEVGVVRIDLKHRSVAGGLAAVAMCMHIVGLAGSAVGIDPGRPTVPAFGRKLYHLGGPASRTPTEGSVTAAEIAAIERKAGLRVATLAVHGRLEYWRQAIAKFRASLRQAVFGAIAFDYDGTLCGAAERWAGPGADIAERLTDLLRAGVLLGIATGRGKSVRKDIQRLLPDRSLWDKILVGYHNGGEIAWLSDNTQPPEGPLDDSLRPIFDAVCEENGLSQLVNVEGKLRQITFELQQEADDDEAWPVVERLIRRHAGTGVTLVRSSHSLDALAPGVSKRLLVERVREELARVSRLGAVLCIGDKGKWPGNDFALLEEPHSLSVDEVSPDPATCWNLAAPGERCVPATLGYLRAIQAEQGQFTIDL
jgi:hydroxymethylpyrimidine pyrophosphatase-like HAD family hydrolase